MEDHIEKFKSGATLVETATTESCGSDGGHTQEKLPCITFTLPHATSKYIFTFVSRASHSAFLQTYMLCLYDLNSVLEKDPVGSKLLERNVFVSNSEIKAEKEQPDHDVD